MNDAQATATANHELLPEDSPLAQLWLDHRRVVVGASSQARRWLGDELEGQKFEKLLAKSDRVGHATYLAKLSTYSGGYLDTFASMNLLDGPQLCRIRMRRNANDEWFVLFELLDADDPVRVLLQSREHQRAVIRNATEGIAFLDTETKIVEFNPRFLEIGEFRSRHGIALNEASIFGRPFADVAGDRFRPIIEALNAERERDRTYDDRIHTGEQTLQVLLTPTFLARDLFGGYVLSIEDVTSEEELSRLRIENARTVGQAEIATSILHNVGNSLNSLSIGHKTLTDYSESPHAFQIQQAIEMLDCEDPVAFLQSDHGSKCIPCLRALSKILVQNQSEVQNELSQMARHIDHIRSIVAKQQRYAKNVQAKERCQPRQLFEDAVGMTLQFPAKKGISIERSFVENSSQEIDRQRTLEILVNLIKNAVDSVIEVDSIRLIELSTKRDEQGMLCFGVRDSGIGIAPNDLDKVFRRGFTTKDSGHGFGLHSCACIAGEMGGSLTCHSDGPRQGAEFTLRLPID